MLLAEYDFTPRSRSARGHRALEDAVQVLIGALDRNGQLCGEPVVGWVGGNLRIVCSLPHAAALEVRHHSSEGRGAAAEVRAACASAPRLRVLDDRARTSRVPAWRRARALYLFTTMLDQTSPVCSGRDGRPVPLYLLPLSDEARRGLSAWADQYRTLDRLYMASGTLERGAYRQLADPRSGLAREGRALARDVEGATGLPTYYYLHRYWGRRRGEEGRPCPGCGSNWNRIGARSGRGLEWFEFRCELCRLVSIAGVVADSTELARIGDWPSLRRRVL